MGKMANKGLKYKKITQAQKLEIADYYINVWSEEEGTLKSPTISQLAEKYEMITIHSLSRSSKVYSLTRYSDFFLSLFILNRL